jgi:5,10-methylenetetrahydromethanopterin reductase
MGIELGVGLFWKGSTYSEIVALIEECEALGYDQLWIANEKFFHEMYVTAAVAAEHTKRARIGTFIADPYSHHPALTATAVATLDEVSGGRAILGLGAGGTGFPAMGIRRVKPAKAIGETIHIVRRLWQGELVDFQGEVIRLVNGRLNFRARPDIPIVVASRGDLVLQTAGEMADGAMIATYAEPTGLRHALEMVEKGARKAGRQLEDLKLISRVDACVSEDRGAAIEALKPMVGVFLWTSYPDREFVRRLGLEVPAELEEIIAKRDYNLIGPNAHLVPDEFVDRFCWAGTPEEVAEKVGRVVQMGIGSITLLPHPPKGGSVHETIRAFSRTIRAKVDTIAVEGARD